MISDPATIVYFYVLYSPVVEFSLHHYSTGVRWKVKGSNAIVIQDCSENTCIKSRIQQKKGVEGIFSENGKYNRNRRKVFHTIAFERISERLTLKSFHELSPKSVRIDLIATFWRAVATKELYHIT